MKARHSRLWLWPVSVAAAGAALAVGRHWAPAWIGGFLTSRLTMIAGLWAIGSAASLIVLCGVMLRLGQGRRPASLRSVATAQEGTAAVEFALVFPVALSVVLILIQSMLLMAGNLAVNAAAYAAARSAVVWIGENGPLSTDPYDSNRNKLTDTKLEHIRLAAVYAVLPVSSGKSSASGEGTSTAKISEALTKFFQNAGQPVPNWVSRLLAAKYNYASENTQVTLDPPENGISYGSHEDLQVHVQHNLFLSVPYANHLFGDPTGNGGDYTTAAGASFALPNEGVQDNVNFKDDPAASLFPPEYYDP